MSARFSCESPRPKMPSRAKGGIRRIVSVRGGGCTVPNFGLASLVWARSFGVPGARGAERFRVASKAPGGHL